MRRHSRIGILMVLGLLFSSSAWAQEVRGTLTVAAPLSPQLTTTDQSPLDAALLGLLSLRVDDIPVPGAERAHVVLQGWGQLGLGEGTLEPDSAELGLLFVESTWGPVMVRLGRFHVATAGARMGMLDGVDARLLAPWGTKLEGFFGAVVPQRFQYRQGSWAGGLRLAQALPGQGEMALAFRQEERGGAVAFQTLGGDAFYLVGPVRLAGSAIGSLSEEALVEARLAVSWHVFEGLDLNLEARHTTPELFIPSTSLFSVFADITRDGIGLDGLWRPDRYWDISASFESLLLGGEWLGYRATARAVTYREPQHRSLLGVEVQRLDEEVSGYISGRAFVSLLPLSELRTTGEFTVYGFDEAVNGTSWSMVGRATVSYDILPSLRVTGSMGGGSTPRAQAFVEGLVRLIYGYSVDLGQEVTP